MVHLRPAALQDYPSYVRYFAELGVDDPVLDRIRWERENLGGTHLLTDGATVGGYAFVRPLQGDAQVVHVVVDPAQRGRGLGKTIMTSLAVRLRQLRCSRWS